MAKLLTTASFVTQSSPTTPSSGYGTLYASGSSLYYKNSSGVDYNISIVGSSSISVYTGSATWNKPSNIQYIKVVCIGAGGGGGGGRINASGGTSGGGEGGAGGNVATAYFSSTSLTGTAYSINVPSGGPGGGRISAAGITNGNSGTTPGTSSFSSGSTILVSANGGLRGRGGGITAGTGPINIIPTSPISNLYPPFYFTGQDGGQDLSGQGYGDATTFAYRVIAGGGSGGRVFAGDFPSRGGSGSSIYSYTTLVRSGSPAAAGSGLPGDNGAPVIDVAHLFYYSGSNITTGVRIGTGGHGGGGGNGTAPFTVSGGDGGTGSLCAGGGGGGGARPSASYTFSGAGGRGGGGCVVIFEYY
jgi:hypothetical protein